MNPGPRAKPGEGTLLEGTYTCWKCGARVEWEGERFDDCLACGAPTIVVTPHMLRRTVKGQYDRYHGRGPDRVVESVDPDFPFFAQCGDVSAISGTEAGAVEMVERILKAKADRG